MVTIVMKTTFKKVEPKVFMYRDYKYFCNGTSRTSLQNILLKNLKNICDDHYNNFVISCKNVLDKIAPWKKKYVRGNHSPFMNKTRSKAIMAKKKLWNTFLKNRSEEKKKRYNTQRNYCVSLSRTSKRDYYNNLNEKKIRKDHFWKVVKSLSSNKIGPNERITLVEGQSIIKTNQENAE